MIRSLLTVLAVMALASSVRAQTVTWEGLPVFPSASDIQWHSVLFFPQEGAAGDDPTRDDLFAVNDYGVFR